MNAHELDRRSAPAGERLRRRIRSDADELGGGGAIQHAEGDEPLEQ